MTKREKMQFEISQKLVAKVNGLEMRLSCMTSQTASYLRDLEQAQKEIRTLKERLAAIHGAAEAISHGAALIEALR